MTAGNIQNFERDARMRVFLPDRAGNIVDSIIPVRMLFMASSER